MIEKQLKIIQDNLAGIAQDIKEFLADAAATDHERYVLALDEAVRGAKVIGKSVYLIEYASGWKSSPRPPSRYYEGKVIQVRPDCSVQVHHFDGCKGDD